MLGKLAEYELPWESLKIVQVDERAAPDGDPDNLAASAASFDAVNLTWDDNTTNESGFRIK